MTTWMSIEQATEYVGGKDPRVIRAAIQDGNLPAYTYTTAKNRPALRVTTDDVDTWLKSRPFNG